MDGNVWPYVVVHWFHIRPLRICVGNDASEFRSNFERMGVPGVLLRHICHASHVLLVFAYFTITFWVRAMSMGYAWVGCLLSSGLFQRRM